MYVLVFYEGLRQQHSGKRPNLTFHHKHTQNISIFYVLKKLPSAIVSEKEGVDDGNIVDQNHCLPLL